MFRTMVKQLAATQGYQATFMAKPFIEESGSGLHCHYSLWKGGKNIFADGGKLNDTGRHFVGGLQARMVETAITGTMTVNGYRRRQPYTFCPINTAWGYDNRTVALRVIEGSDSAVRVEKRDASADCNPYLLMAADIAAGLDGIEGKVEPADPCMGNAYEDGDAAPLPGDLAAAVALARGSDWLKDVLGEHVHEIVCQQGERELEFFANQVTPVELQRYLDAF